jgi:hypothetical protein
MVWVFFVWYKPLLSLYTRDSHPTYLYAISVQLPTTYLTHTYLTHIFNTYI